MAAGAPRPLVVVGRGPHRRRRQPGAVAALDGDELLALAAAVRATRARRSSSSRPWARSPRAHRAHGRHVAGRQPAAQLEPVGSLSPTEVYEQQLTSCDHAEEKGAHVVALALPDLMRMRTSRGDRRPPGLARGGEAVGTRRARSRPRGARSFAGCRGVVRRGPRRGSPPGTLEIADAPAATQALVGQSIADVAAEPGVDPVDVLIDVVLPDRLPAHRGSRRWCRRSGARTSRGRQGPGCGTTRVVLGGSDAGAHADLMCHANYTTVAAR